ncbi:unnamed protein product [Vicia faba]|uniref:Reverse transcriptase n=1 Tax=Vicia faba TaxID=3906 RepID=A0AAV0YHP4_VICFA|nr:unnamed protein product [Vicia faba]
MLFTRGCTSSLDAIADLFTKYVDCSGQVCNPTKSTTFARSMAVVRHGFLASRIGFKMEHLPFSYLGVPIFKGRPKAIYLQPVADKIKVKLEAWKAILLSIAGIIQLVNCHSYMLLYSFRIYSCPVNLIKTIESWCMNFIWSGNIEKRNLVIAAWDQCCQDIQAGGLGIRSLRTLNEANNFVQCWSIINEIDCWASILKARVFKRNRQIKCHVFSSNLDR